MPEPDETPEDAFWRFSLAFYALPGVENALLALQERDGLDVNFILLALWLGLSGHGKLDHDTLAEAERSTNAIRNEIVDPLRTLRRALRRYSDDDIQRLREDVKVVELAAEKLMQSRLARLAGPPAEMLPETRLAAARANLALCLGPDRMRGGDAILILAAVDAFVAPREPRPSV